MSPPETDAIFLYLLQGLLVDSQRRVDFSLFNIQNLLVAVVITHCFSLLFRDFMVYTTQFGHLKPRRNPLLVLNKRPHCGRLWLRGGRYDPRAFSCFIFSPKNRPLFRRRFPDKPPVLAARPSGVHGCHPAPCAATQRPTGANTRCSARCLHDIRRREYPEEIFQPGYLM